MLHHCRESNNDAVCSVSLRLTKIYERDNLLFYWAGIQCRSRKMLFLDKIETGSVDFSGRTFLIH